MKKKKAKEYKIIEMQYSNGKVCYSIKKKSWIPGLWLTYVTRANHYCDDVLWGIFSFDPVTFDTVLEAEKKIYQLAKNHATVSEKVVELVTV